MYFQIDVSCNRDQL